MKVLVIVLANVACSAGKYDPKGGTPPRSTTTADASAALARVGRPAPDFVLPNLEGQQVRMSSFKGKTIVLEWFNPDCPFVKHAHDDGALKDMAASVTGDPAYVWLAINSGAPGKQGHGRDKNAAARATWKLTHPVLLDEDGHVGKMYGAKRTPHMFVIDSTGTLVYRGALDNTPKNEQQKEAPVNYVKAALEDLRAGRRVATPENEPYGCSVKYAD